MRVEPNEMSDFESVLRKTGWGLYHKFLLGIACACAFSESAAFLSIPFVLPVASCDLLISEKYLKYFYLSFVCGMSIGGMLLSGMSDLIGRKSLLHLTFVMISISLLGCAFSHEWIMLLFFTFCLGSGLASNSNIIRILLCECLTTERRAYMLIIVDLAASFGYIVFSAMNWWMIPFAADLGVKGFRFCTFRIMFALPALPNIIIACASALLLPSPRFLLLREKYEAAIKILQQIYTTNNDKLYEGFRVQIQDIQSYVNDYGVNTFPEPHNCSEQIIYTFKKLLISFTIIMKGNFVAITIALILLNVMVSPGVFIINMWLAKGLSHKPNEICTFEGMDMLYIESINKNKCKFDADLSIYQDFLSMSISLVAGKVLLLLSIPFFPRRLLILTFYIFCGSCCYLFILTKSYYVIRYIISSTILILFSAIETILTLCTIELFPTAIRGMTSGCIKSVPYLLRGVIAYLLNSSCDFIPVAIGAMMLSGGLFSCFLQERQGLPMVE